MMMADKLIAVASKEVGVCEPSGDDKYTKWYNAQNGTSFAMNTPWCCIFVSWCANKAGVPTSIIKYFASCTQMTNWFISKGLYKKRGEYTPRSGEIIMYDWDYSGDSDHVGIVESVENGYAVVIEGNYSKCVKRRRVNLSSSNVRGFCIPDFPSGDMNNDGKLTASDANTILQAAVKKTTLSAEQKKDADVDGDGKISASDAMDVLKKSTKK